MMKNKLTRGASSDAILLMLIKLVTTALGFVVTRLLSEHLSVYDYGTYSQVLLVVSTVSSLTILGMMDGMNFFYCSEQDVQKRESYIATIFALQCAVGAVAGSIVLLLRNAICTNFENPDVGRLLIFAALLPLMQNLLSMLQILIVSVGKARLLAVRNLVVSILRLIVVILVVAVVQNVAVILLTTLLLDVAQIALFAWTLRRSGCVIHGRNVRWRMTGQIFRYCVPMAVFVAVSTLSRDCDKYLITLMTDTETLAVYSNASKTLPFDIVMTSFTTVLLPQITRLVAAKAYEKAIGLYKVFLEIAYISTAILCCAALAASPQLMELLYSKKYISGLGVFCIYILVDLLRVTNITLILSAAGKTKKLMLYSVGALVLNVVLNWVLYSCLGIIGPALATLITTAVLGLCILGASARELGGRIGDFFDGKFLACFAAENLATVLLLYRLQQWLASLGLHYFVVLVLICGLHGAGMLLLHGKRLFADLKLVNSGSKN